MGTEGGGHPLGTTKTGMEGARVCSEEGSPGPLLQPFQSSLRMDAQDCSLWASGQPSPDPEPCSEDMAVPGRGEHVGSTAHNLTQLGKEARWDTPVCKAREGTVSLDEQRSELEQQRKTRAQGWWQRVREAGKSY